LNGQRRHVLGILEGLPEEAVHRPVLPSGWTCVGLVHHLAVDVERWWFRDVFAGEPIDSDECLGEGWQVAPEVPSGAVLEFYRRQVELANAIIAAAAPDDPPSNWPEDRWPNWHLDDLRETMLHVITETACHAGHLDAARELIDGRAWLVVTDGTGRASARQPGHDTVSGMRVTAFDVGAAREEDMSWQLPPCS
jgi:hypothetical protein